MKMRAVSVVGLACAVAVLVAGCAVAPPAGSSSSSADRESATRPPSASSPAGVITRPEAAMPTETTAGSSVPAAGAATDSAEGVWITGGSALAVSRDGGAEWQQLPLPDSARVVAAAVLPSEVIAVTGAGSSTLRISTMARGRASWHPTPVAMPPGHQIGNAQLVLRAGVPVGILVTDQSSSQFSRGQWLRAVDGGVSWQIEDAPAGGVATAAGGSLWLVGGPVNTELYRSGDDGVSWQTVALPDAPSLTALGPVLPDGSGVVMPVAIAASLDGATIHMLHGQSSGDVWQWTVGPVLPTSGSFGLSAVPATSLADGTVWLLTTESIVRIALPSEQSQVVAPSGLPSGTDSLDLHAVSSTAAWIDYSVSTCAQFKSDCTTSAGLLRTTDGGATWQPMPSPFAP